MPVHRQSPARPADKGEFESLVTELTLDGNAVPVGTDGGFIVEMEEGHDAREEIAAHAVHQGWGLLEMRPLTRSLEDIFIEIIGGRTN